MTLKRAVQSGTTQILKRCLGLNSNHDLVIFVDETTIDLGITIAEIADCMGIKTTTILVPIEVQRRIPKESKLGLSAQAAAREARAILTCVNARPDCLSFRRRILETNWSARTRIGHMPGASFELLELADVDFDKLIDDCNRVELAMARGQQMKLTSFTSTGEIHHLTVNIGGWERLPVASDSIISDGVWGNVPSGETYIAPIEGSAEGSVVINGSIPGLVINSDEEITLFFKKGRLVEVVPDDNRTARWLNEKQIQTAKDRGDFNWSNLAEIGVGVNPAVQQLTGNMLFDEKAAGTAHIALGNNAFMGGSVESTIHCDMVIKGLTLTIDGKKLLDRGKLCLNDARWRENYRQIVLNGSPVSTATCVARSGIQAAQTSDNRLQRVLRSEPGRKSTCFIGDNKTAKLADTIYGNLSLEGEWLSVYELARLAKLDVDPLRRVLHIMWSYDLIKVR